MPVPVYISPNELPPGTQTLVPKPQVCFWFANSLESQTMVTVDISNTGVVNLPNTTPVTLEYTRNGAWVIKASKSIDYTKP